MHPFVDACLASPIGACLVARLEQQQRPDRTWLSDDPTSNPEYVAQAVSQVRRMSFGAVCEQVLEASMIVGPWVSGAELEAWAAYLHAEERRPVAAAIAASFGDRLHAPIDLSGQEWWLNSSGAAAEAPLFQQLDHVYDNGELSWGALRAYGPTPLDALDCQFGEAPLPHSRWSLPVTTSPRVFEIHRPSDWHRLCVSYPNPATLRSGPDSLPGHRDNLPQLLELPNQHANARDVGTHLCTRWSHVATDYDAVHLSWAGFITTEGFVLNQGSHTTMLRFWDREVTMWLKDCFGTPEPLSLPIECDHLIDAATSPTRLAQDQEVIAKMLARP